jgi:hypothetical protein
MQQRLPFRLPAIEVNLFVHPLDQGFLCRKIAQQILMRGPDALRQVAQSAVETNLREESDGSFDDLAFALGRI